MGCGVGHVHQPKRAGQNHRKPCHGFSKRAETVDFKLCPGIYRDSFQQKQGMAIRGCSNCRDVTFVGQKGRSKKVMTRTNFWLGKAVYTRCLCNVGLVSVLTALVCLDALATPPPKGVAPVLVPAGGFAIDGDLLAGPAGDWVAGSNAGSGVLASNGVPLN